jgi:hypothetical protein
MYINYIIYKGIKSSGRRQLVRVHLTSDTHHKHGDLGCRPQSYSECDILHFKIELLRKIQV